MNHDLLLEGSAFRLRPVTDDDAEFIVTLRSDPQLNKYIHASPSDVSAQLDWLAKYYQREGDYYFIVERNSNGNAEGVISLYDVDAAEKKGEWGRWILKQGSLAAVESALLIYRCAFDELKLNKVFCRTVADNQAVVSFHDSCGITERSELPNHFRFGDRQVDAIEHVVDEVMWSSMRPRLEKLAILTHRRMRRD